MTDNPTLLVGIANPNTIPHLMRFASHIALDANYDVSATHVVATAGDAEAVDEGSRQGEELLRKAAEAAGEHGVAIDSFVETAATVEAGLLSAIEVEDADILLVGYRQERPDDGGHDADSGERQFDDIVHRVARKANCHVVVGRGRRELTGDIVVPAVCETDLRVVGLFVRACARSAGANVRFLQIVEPGADPTRWETQCRDALYMSDLTDIGEVDIIHSGRPMGKLLEEVNRHDLAIVAAPATPSLSESIFGSAAERIAANAECSVLLVRPKD